jgi:glycosyltransferase involved in cell wall biosynthesis
VLATHDRARTLVVRRIAQELASGFPELLHVYHARKAGAPALEAADRVDSPSPPWVVSFGGTDLHLDVKTARKRRVVWETCERSARILAHGRETAEVAQRTLPESMRSKIRYIPRGVEAVPGREFVGEVRAAWGIEPGHTVLVMPAGIRPVKGQRTGILEVARLAARRPELRLFVLGAALDPVYARVIRNKVAALPFARIATPLAREKMGAAYEVADVILNTSRAEGYANAIAEAQAAGCAVIASNAPGNNQAIVHGQTGLLFDRNHEGELAQTLDALLGDPALLEHLRAGALAHATKDLDPVRESNALAAAYAEALGRQ